LNIDPRSLTITEARQMLQSGEISSVELTELYLKRIGEVEPKIHALITVTAESARAQAKAADERIASGSSHPLTGIPAIIKDNMCTRGVRTTCASRMLENFVPPYDATAVARLKEAGTVILGKSNMDEFAMGSSTENSAMACTANPWDLSRVPGGSSGGSTAAVAAGEAVFALGSDTGGSIRQPCGFCSVSGLKPTYGRVSRYGLVAFGSSLDQIGPITRSAADNALVLQTIAGHDERDATSNPDPVPDYFAALTEKLDGIKIGVPGEYFVAGMETGVDAAVRGAISQFENLGARVATDISLPLTPYALAVYYIIAPSEASANLARYDGVKYGFCAAEADSMFNAMEKTRQNGFGAEVRRRIMLGTYALSAGYYDAYYRKAQQVRTLIRREFEEAFEQCDVLVTPTSPTVPFRIGEKTSDPLQMYLSDVCTLPINIAGVPAMSIPCGFADGLPVGLQIIGRPFGEETVLKVAHAFQTATDWHRQTPAV
jgi:aspartyl-tRNA(Asn)/glutamyl-tRNA(Gln) amidotransferase subunit A